MLAKGGRFARWFYGVDDVPVADLAEGSYIKKVTSVTVEAAEALLREEGHVCRGGGEKMISPLSGERNLTMLTDLYQLTMANGYLQKGVSEKRAVFDLFYRGSGGYSYAVAAGLEQAVQYLRDLRFEEKDIAYLRSLGIFPENFLARLKTFRFTGDLTAVPEGTIDLPVRAHPHGVGAHLRGADHRDGAPHHRQSSDPHRDHGGKARRLHGRQDPGVRAAPRAGSRRGHLRRARRVHRRVPFDIQRARGAKCSASRWRAPIPIAG